MKTDLSQQIKAIDLRTYAPRILGTGPNKHHSNHDTYRADVIGRPERTPSLAVYADGFKNYGVGGESGSAIDLAMLAWNCDYGTAVKGLADLLGFARGDRPTPRPALRVMTQIIETAEDFADWQTSAATVDPLPLATDHPAATAFLLSKGYTPQTITARGIRYTSAWVETGYIADGKPAKIAPGIVYTHRDQHGQPVAIFTRLINPKPGKSKVVQTAGGKPKLGIYGNLDTPHAPVIITAGQKDSDLVAQTFPGAVNAITMGSCNVDLPTWATEKIADLHPPFVMVMFDNDPPSEQQEAEKRAATLRPALPCPVIVIPSPKGVKDFADFVTAGGDVGKFWAGIVAPVNAQVVELLCSFKRFAWVDKAHGDPAYLAALLLVRHEAIAGGLIHYDAPLSIKQVVALSETVGHPITEKAARAGVALALQFGVWVEFNLAEFGYLYRDISLVSNLGEVENTPTPLSKFGKVGNNTAQYMPLPAFVGYRNLAAALENEIPTSADDWASGEFLEELARLNIRDTRPTQWVDHHDFDGTIYQEEISETLDLLNRLVFLSDATALLLDSFVWPDGFTLDTYPGKPEDSRPNAPKCLRVALLRVLSDQNSRTLTTAEGETIEGWQVSAAALANRLGIAMSSVNEYRRAAGVTTREQKPRATILSDGNKRQQAEKLIGQRRGGVTVWIGAKPSYLTDKNRASVLAAIERTAYSVAVEIQLPSIQYVAPLDEIEGIHQARSERHKARVERAKRERAATGDDQPTPTKTARQTPQIAPDAPEIAEPGYSKWFVYYHLLKMLPDLLEAAKTSVLITRVLVGYGLMCPLHPEQPAIIQDSDQPIEGDDMPTFTANTAPHEYDDPSPVYELVAGRFYQVLPNGKRRQLKTQAEIDVARLMLRQWAMPNYKFLKA